MTTPLILSDEAIAFRAGVYAANPMLTRLGITFEMFLSQPHWELPGPLWAPLNFLTRKFGYLPLLPAQRAVAKRLMVDEDALTERALGVAETQITNHSPAVHGNALIEKLRHRTHPRRRTRRIFEEISA